MLLEIIDKQPDIKVVVIDEDRKTDRKTRPQNKKANKTKMECVPQENGVVILSTAVKPWKGGIFYVHNLKFEHFGRYVMRFTLVAPAACMARALATEGKKAELGTKKGDKYRYDNFNSQDPEIIIRMLQERDMVTVSKPFDYTVDLLKENKLFLKGPLDRL